MASISTNNIDRIETTQKTFGSVMSFTLQEEGQGLEPADVTQQWNQAQFFGV
jgi:hypothetical protein